MKNCLLILFGGVEKKLNLRIQRQVMILYTIPAVNRATTLTEKPAKCYATSPSSLFDTVPPRPKVFPRCRGCVNWMIHHLITIEWWWSIPPDPRYATTKNSCLWDSDEWITCQYIVEGTTRAVVRHLSLSSPSSLNIARIRPLMYLSVAISSRLFS